MPGDIENELEAKVIPTSGRNRDGRRFYLHAVPAPDGWVWTVVDIRKRRAYLFTTWRDALEALGRMVRAEEFIAFADVDLEALRAHVCDGGTMELVYRRRGAPIPM